jgi:hypothetical protein
LSCSWRSSGRALPGYRRAAARARLSGRLGARRLTIAALDFLRVISAGSGGHPVAAISAAGALRSVAG